MPTRLAIGYHLGIDCKISYHLGNGYKLGYHLTLSRGCYFIVALSGCYRVITFFFFFLGGGAFSGVGNACKHHLYEVVMSLCREQDSAFPCLGP